MSAPCNSATQENPQVIALAARMWYTCPLVGGGVRLGGARVRA